MLKVWQPEKASLSARSLGHIARAAHVFQTTFVLNVAITQPTQGFFGNLGTTAATAIQDDTGITIGNGRRNPVGNLLVRNVNRIPDMAFAVFLGAAHVNDRGLIRAQSGCRLLSEHRKGQQQDGRCV